MHRLFMVIVIFVISKNLIIYNKSETENNIRGCVN